LALDISIVTLLFFKFLPDARLSWRDVRLGAALTAALFLVGKYALGFYLGSGGASSAYGAAGSLIKISFAYDFQSYRTTQVDIERLVGDTHSPTTQLDRAASLIQHHLVVLKPSSLRRALRFPGALSRPER
jgi:hypothetical protein